MNTSEAFGELMRRELSAVAKVKHRGAAEDCGSVRGRPPTARRSTSYLAAPAWKSTAVSVRRPRGTRTMRTIAVNTRATSRFATTAGIPM